MTQCLFCTFWYYRYRTSSSCMWYVPDLVPSRLGTRKAGSPSRIGCENWKRKASKRDTVLRRPAQHGVKCSWPDSRPQDHVPISCTGLDIHRRPVRSVNTVPSRSWCGHAVYSTVLYVRCMWLDHDHPGSSLWQRIS